MSCGPNFVVNPSRAEEVLRLVQFFVKLWAEIRFQPWVSLICFLGLLDISYGHLVSERGTTTMVPNHRWNSRTRGQQTTEGCKKEAKQFSIGLVFTCQGKKSSDLYAIMGHCSADRIAIDRRIGWWYRRNYHQNQRSNKHTIMFHISPIPLQSVSRASSCRHQRQVSTIINDDFTMNTMKSDNDVAEVRDDESNDTDDCNGELWLRCTVMNHRLISLILHHWFSVLIGNAKIQGLEFKKKGIGNALFTIRIQQRVPCIS